ncbi:hypothetical protein [Tautonia rosea]|uniref:hypothetical protein n=1 Tax=Tautonia rosea TaxID=2728037 RepID=UPI001472A06D|nr:hypothetical protein [Tautonia rosea]
MPRKLQRRTPLLESLEVRTLLSTVATPDVLQRTQVAALVAAPNATPTARPTGLLRAAESIDSQSIRLEFRRPIPSHFAPRLRFEVEGLQVTGVQLARNGRGAVLTTSPQADATYTIRMANVRGEGARAQLVPRGMAPFQGKAAPRVVDVASTGETTVLVSFDRPMGTGAIDPGNYQLSGDAGQPIGVASARFVGGSTSQVELQTTPQAFGSYTIHVNNITDTAGQQIFFDGRRFTGNPQGAVLSVAATSSTTVVVAFNEPMADNALAPQHYDIRDSANRRLTVTGARFDGPLGMVVVLTTAAQANESYRLTTLNITDLSNSSISRRSGTFRGIPAPSLVAAIPTQPTRIVLTFSGPVGDSALAPSSYKIEQLDEEGSPIGTLPIEAARFVGGQRTVIELATGSQLATTYRITTAATLTDEAGSPLRSANARFTGIGPRPEALEFAGPPRVVGAASLSNFEVLVSFSEPMADNATRPEHFVIAQENVNPEAGALLVTNAEFYNGDRTVVKLTTRSQNELTYRVTVVNATDLAGNALAPKVTSSGVLVDPTSATFPGTPPSGDQLVDTDGDGLTDNEEQRGWLVVFRTADGRLVERMVTSDISVADTDGDGFTDDVELQLKTDPRDADTDDDLLTDYQEYTEVFSNHLDADSDGDGVDDGTEFLYVRSSPNLEDTDGDQIDDGTEITLGGFYNVLVANLPIPRIDVGNVALSLRVDTFATSSTGTRRLDSKTAESSLVRTQSTSFTSVSETTQEAFSNFAFGQQFNVGADYTEYPALELSASQEFGTSSAVRSEFTASSSQETQRSLSEARTTEQEVQAGEELQTQVTDAKLQTTINLQNASPIAFRLKNLQVTALIAAPENPAVLLPVATLVPEFEPEDGFVLGPLVPARGPIVMTSDNVFPNRVEALMADPRSLIFRISNYDIIDESDRNFAFSSQEVVERTGRIEIDYGGFDADGDGRDDPSEILFVSTAAGRVIDTDGDGDIDSDDRRVTFGPDGFQVGRSVRDLLADAGLTEYTIKLDEENRPILDPDFDPALGIPIYYNADGEQVKLTRAQIRSSYATMRVVASDPPDGSRVVERIYRFRERAVVQFTDFPDTTWEVITPQGIDPDKGLDDILYAGQSFTLAFVQDSDGDFLPANLEAFFGSRDDSRDSDGDGLDDRFEALIGWDVNIPDRGTVRVTSHPGRTDSDNDGLSDRAEAPALWRDLDGDGLMDDGELTRSAVFFVTRNQNPNADPNALVLTFASGPDANGNYTPIFFIPIPATDLGNGVVRIAVTPFSDIYMDENSDGSLDLFNLNNRPFIDYITNPLDPDSDRDLISDRDEVRGFAYRPIDSATDVVVYTNPERADTDGDSVIDGLERRFGLNPSDGQDRDTDRDGLPDRVETNGWLVTTEALTLAPLSVTPGNQVQRRITSDPTSADSDGDGLTDFEEFFLRTSPADIDTDGDGLRDIDEVRGFRMVGNEDRANELITLDPLDADVDNDGLSDGEEAGLGLDAAGRPITLGVESRWIVQVPGEEPRRVFTDPREPDGDNDGLPDGAEKYRTGSTLLGGTTFINYDRAIDLQLNLQIGTSPFFPTGRTNVVQVSYVLRTRVVHFRLIDAQGVRVIDTSRPLAELPSEFQFYLETLGFIPQGQIPGRVASDKPFVLAQVEKVVGLNGAPRIFLGADPEKANTDGDRRTDLEEVRRGTDPTTASYFITVQFDHFAINSDNDANDGDPGAGNTSLLGAGDFVIKSYIRLHDPNSTSPFQLGNSEMFFNIGGDGTRYSDAVQVHFGSLENFTGTSQRSRSFTLDQGQAFSLGTLLTELDDIDINQQFRVNVFLGDLTEEFNVTGLDVKVNGTSRSSIFTSEYIQSLLDAEGGQTGVFQLVYEFTKDQNTPAHPTKIDKNEKVAGRIALRLIVE